MRHVVAEEWNVECEGHGEGRRQGWNKRTRAKVVALVRFDPLHNFASTPNSVPGIINFVPLRSGPHPFLVGLGATAFAFSAPNCPPTKMRVVGRAFCPPSTREGRSGTCCSAVAATAATAAAAAVAAAAATAAAAVAAAEAAAAAAAVAEAIAYNSAGSLSRAFHRICSSEAAAATRASEFLLSVVTALVRLGRPCVERKVARLQGCKVARLHGYTVAGVAVP